MVETSINSVGVDAVLSFVVQLSVFDCTMIVELLHKLCFKFVTNCSSGDGTDEWLVEFGNWLLFWLFGIRSSMISSTLAAQWRISSKDKFVPSDKPTRKWPNRSSPSSVWRRSPEMEVTRHDVAIRVGDTSRNEESVVDMVMRSRVWSWTVLAIFFNRISFVWGCKIWWVNSWFKIVYGVTAAKSQFRTRNTKSSHSYNWKNKY